MMTYNTDTLKQAPYVSLLIQRVISDTMIQHIVIQGPTGWPITGLLLVWMTYIEAFPLQADQSQSSSNRARESQTRSLTLSFLTNLKTTMARMTITERANH